MSEPLLTRTQKKHLRRTLMMGLASLFLLEAWLWDTMGAAVALLVRHLPFERWRLAIAEDIERLNPWQTLGLFVIPVLVLLPFKFFALWLLAEGNILSGILTVVAAKLMGLGVTSFLFVLCKPKLLQLRGVRWLYEQCVYWRARAHEILAPYMRIIRRYMAALRPQGAMGKALMKLRARMHAKR